MKFTFLPMNLEYATIIKNWKYTGFMVSIYMDPYFDNYNDITKEMKGPGGCTGFAVLDNEVLIGLFEYYFKDGIMEIGLALNPDYVGKGLSKDFINSGIIFGVNRFNYKKDYVKLLVEKENIAARKSYLKAGFKEYNVIESEIEMRKNL